jgi:hypothetical protein
MSKVSTHPIEQSPTGRGVTMRSRVRALTPSGATSRRGRTEKDGRPPGTGEVTRLDVLVVEEGATLKAPSSPPTAWPPLSPEAPPTAGRLPAPSHRAPGRSGYPLWRHPSPARASSASPRHSPPRPR